MNNLMDAILDACRSAGRSADLSHELPTVIRLESGASRELASYCRDADYAQILLVTDECCYEAVGRDVAAYAQEAGLRAHIVFIRLNAAGDVVADEASIVQVLLEIQRLSADACVALGSGTVHDIVRYAAYSSRIPFVSVPTAPSVDGFTSRGAPLIVRGEKITVPAIGPSAIFADLNILAAAPAPMIAAGFGDMLGKYTSLFDWQFGRLAAGEPYDPFVHEMTRQALQSCADHAEEIGRGTKEGVAVLMRALIESGIAMLIFGQSHPASGGEHHLSHYWEMAFIRSGRRQLLHGAKVGVACSIIAELYKRVAADGLPPVREGAEPHAAYRAAATHWAEIRKLAAALPDPAVIMALLRAAGGPADIGELGIDAELRDEALREAHHVRPGRTTLLRVYNTASQG